MEYVSVVRAAATDFGSPPEVKNWNPAISIITKTAIATAGAKSLMMLAIIGTISDILAGSWMA